MENVNSTNVAHEYIQFLSELCSLGTTIRKLIVKYMLDEEFYADKIKSESNPNPSNDNTKIRNHFHKTFLDLIESTEKSTVIVVPQKLSLPFDPSYLKSREYTNILNELLYWCIRYEFPEDFVQFLLCLLPEYNYKTEYLKSFILHYYFISNMILMQNSNNLSCRVIHVSVQLFSSEQLALKALNDYHVLEVIMLSLNNIIKNPKNVGIIKPNEINDSSRHLVINTEHHVLQENLYWPIVSDLANLLSHKQVRSIFF
jgi:hypothetical protein